ncbi:uncharacterized protein LOC135945879 [Cloeon dipterum]|uniref:uncharacterized protein LOC135945879 n=1 Tax=Cloeon dipterum TaxID=197152 RepID=UPI00321FDE07
MAMAGEALQMHQQFHNGGVDRFHGTVRTAEQEQSKQCFLNNNNNSVDYVFRVNSLRNNNLNFDRQQTIRIRVSSIDEPDDLEQPDATLAANTNGEERLSKEEQLSRGVQNLQLEPSSQQQLPRVVLCSSAPCEPSACVSRSRSPSPLLEVPVERVDISREIRRPPL